MLLDEQIELLFTIDEGYLNPLKVALTSIRQNNPGQAIRIWLIHESITRQTIRELQKLTDYLQFGFEAIEIDGSRWNSAKTEDRYPKEMYFRLLAGAILPEEMKRVIYLDPDILVVNPLLDLWQIELEDHMLAAATHVGLTDVSTRVNQMRLDVDHAYYNSGVMVIDLDKAREIIKWSDIARMIEKYNLLLFLPDQDILNHLYGKYTKEIPEEIWNYDTRKYMRYFTKSLTQHDIHWVMSHTVILHFCGGPKPWDDKHDNRFTSLYLNYQNQLAKIEEKLK